MAGAASISRFVRQDGVESSQTIGKEHALGRGTRKPIRWNKDRQRKKKARDQRKIDAGKAAAATAAAGK